MGNGLLFEFSLKSFEEMNPSIQSFMSQSESAVRLCYRDTYCPDLDGLLDCFAMEQETVLWAILQPLSQNLK